MTEILITKVVLEIYDKYDQDFGLLSERWASDSDREKVSDEQCLIFGEYIRLLQSITRNTTPAHAKEFALGRISEIETIMDLEVVAVLRERYLV